MAVGDSLPHCSGTGTSGDPYIFTTEQGLKEAIAVDDCVYESTSFPPGCVINFYD